MIVEADVIVDVDTDLLPVGVLVGSCRQWFEGGTIESLVELPP